MLRMAPDTSEEGVRPIQSQVTPSLVWLSSLQEPEARHGHLSLSHPSVTQQRGPPAWEPVGLKRKIPLMLQWGKAFLTHSRPRVCSHIVGHAWPLELNKSEALAAAREALLALVWAEKIRRWGEDSWPECSPSSHSQPSSRAPHIGAQE